MEGSASSALAKGVPTSAVTAVGEPGFRLSHGALYSYIYIYFVFGYVFGQLCIFETN